MKFIKYEGENPFLIELNRLYDNATGSWQMCEQAYAVTSDCRAEIIDKQRGDTLKARESEIHFRTKLQTAQLAYECGRIALAAANARVARDSRSLELHISMMCQHIDADSVEGQVALNNRVVANRVVANRVANSGLTTLAIEDLTDGEGEDVLRMYFARLNGEPSIAKRLRVQGLQGITLLPSFPDPSDTLMIELLELIQQAASANAKLKQTWKDFMVSRVCSGLRSDFISDQIALGLQLQNGKALVDKFAEKQRQIYETMPDWHGRYDLETRQRMSNVVTGDAVPGELRGLIGLIWQQYPQQFRVAESMYDPTDRTDMHKSDGGVA